MGYDMSIAVFKKKSLNEAQKLFPKYTFKDLYSDLLFRRLRPDIYDIPEDEKGRWITWANRNIFRDFFEPKLENDEAVIINEVTYNKMVDWLEKKLKSKTLYDCACNKEYDDYKVAEMIRVYRQMKEEKIDYVTEFIVYQHDW